MAHDFAKQSVVCYTLCRRCRENQSYPDFQRLVLLSDFFGLTLDELVKDIDVQEVREKNLNSERLNSIYSDVENAKKIIKWGAIIGGCIAAVLLIVVIVLIFSFVY